MRRASLQRRQQRGQAMVEMAIVLPLLLVLMLAVGYFGHAVITLQTLNSGARAAAREMALESTETSDLRMFGSYAASGDRFLELSRGYLKGRVRTDELRVRAQTDLKYNYKDVLGLKGAFTKLSEHRYVYRLTQTVNATDSAYNSPAPKDLKGHPPKNLTALDFSLGVVFYGGTLQYRLTELIPLSRFIFQNSDDPAIRMGATALMPAELPLRGQDYGLFSMDPWLSGIVSQSVDDPEVYPDLIPAPH